MFKLGRTGLLLMIWLTLVFTGTGLAAAGTSLQGVMVMVEDTAVINVVNPDNPGTEPTLTISPPAAGGDLPADAVDSSTYLYYTSIVETGMTRSVTAQVTSAEDVPSGLRLYLEAIGDNLGTNEGTSLGEQQINAVTATTLITSIGSCATGRTKNDGALLAYRLDVNDITSVIKDTTSLEVTFTLTEDAAPSP